MLENTEPWSDSIRMYILPWLYVSVLWSCKKSLFLLCEEISQKSFIFFFSDQTKSPSSARWIGVKKDYALTMLSMHWKIDKSGCEEKDSCSSCVLNISVPYTTLLPPTFRWSNSSHIPRRQARVRRFRSGAMFQRLQKLTFSADLGLSLSSLGK